MAISRQETSAGTFFIIKDPATGSFFRIREAEQFIAAQLDGTTVMDVVRQRTEQKFQAALSEESLNTFVKTLNNIGLLESKQTSAPGPERLASGTQRSLLYFRVSLFDPDRLFNILEPRLRWMFTSTFVLCSASTITLGLVSVVANWDQYLSDLGRLYNAAIVPIAILLSFLVVGLHEFAHGLTCKHFGGEVHEIGFLLFYFQPALYCNVSDAWLFQNRSSRLWVGFAGPYFELSVWAAAVMAWRVLDPETWLSTVALIIMTTSGIKTILNFNPFLKLDGYYLLSDYLEIPNLRRRSFRHVGNGFRRLIGLEPTLEKPASTRERRIYTVYGLVASAGSFMLLAYIVASAGGLLIEKGTPVLAVLSAVLIFVRLRHRFTRMFGRGSNSATSDEDGDVLSHSHAAPEPAARSDRRRRKGPSWRRWLRRGVLLALLGVLGCMAWFGHTDLRIAGPFTIAPKEPTDIRTAVEGVVESIDVGEGSSVQAGQIVMRLSDRELRSDLAKTEAEIRETAARIRLLETGPLSD
ncbi:MAG TPA: hypothetical protein VES20_25510, partial [Bryobacteraceae bacterium]|nr:hypothetical protein [Bryobacteraceae bacterium]